jgi:hypothetical protein
LIVVGFCTVTWVVVCFLTKPTSEEHLKKFCAKVKPFPTLWGPIYAKYPELDWNRHFTRSCVNWALGSATVFCACFGFGHLLFLNFTYGFLLLTLAVILAVIILAIWRK